MLKPLAESLKGKVLKYAMANNPRIPRNSSNSVCTAYIGFKHGCYLAAGRRFAECWAHGPHFNAISSDIAFSNIN